MVVCACCWYIVEFSLSLTPHSHTPPPQPCIHDNPPPAMPQLFFIVAAPPLPPGSTLKTTSLSLARGMQKTLYLFVAMEAVGYHSSCVNGGVVVGNTSSSSPPPPGGLTPSVVMDAGEFTQLATA